MTSHAVVGRGGSATPATVVHAGLRDLLTKGDSLVLPWYGGAPSDSLAAVYEYVLDHEIDYTLVYAGKAPSPVFDEAHTYEAPETLYKAMAQLTDYEGSVALLFPDQDDISSDVFEFLDSAGREDMPLLDLTNGLVPVKIADEDQGPQEEDSGDDDDDISKFTREELEALPFKILKRAASQYSETVPTSASQAIAIILGEAEAATEEEEAPSQSSQPELDAETETSDVLAAARSYGKAFSQFKAAEAALQEAGERLTAALSKTDGTSS